MKKVGFDGVFIHNNVFCPQINNLDMKRLTLISLGITALGFLLINVGMYIGPLILMDIGNFLLSIGIFMIYVFLIAWQAEVGRTSVIITATALGLFFLSFMIYGFIKADEAEKHANFSYEMALEKEAQIKGLNDKLLDARNIISSLEADLKECSSSTP